MSTAIHKLRIRTAEPDTHAVERRVAAMLNAAELRPRALPPASILVVRRLGPGLPPIRLDGHSIRPPADWQEAVLDELDRLARQALRPARHPVPERAESVLFLDRAELLACLGSDLVDGTLPSHWWWPGLFPRENLQAAAVRTWTESPEYAPAAIERLAWTRHAAAFVRQLPEAALHTITQNVLRAFALRDLERALELVLETALEDAPPVPHPAASAPASPPWAPWVPEAREPALTFPQRVFLGIALAFQRAPQAVRDRAFAAQAKAWAQTAVSVELARPPQSALPLADLPPIVDAHAQPTLAPLTLVDTPAPTSEAAAPAESPPAPAPAPSPDPAQFDGVQIETQYGGLFYLINLAIYLGYYGDFSTPAEPGIALPIWDFLTLVGCELLDAPPAEDPVWDLLATLVGRTPWSARVPPDPLPNPAEPHWDGLAEAMPRIRSWIAAEAVEGLVLMHHARVHLTDTHLDVFLSLEDLPIEIRIARLDRDPGWVPAAGRYIAFHFQ